MSNIVYSIVVPMFNEELVIAESYKRLKSVMDSFKEPYEIVFVNDGSRDKTGSIIRGICEKDPNIKLVDFSRNFGHQIAITAGMDHTVGQAIVVIDGDLQDPPEVIAQMAAKWREGYDVVYGKRASREGETFFKKFTAKMFYRVLRKMTDVDIPVDTGDFRLIDRKVCDALKQVNEHNRYIRGLISWLGFKQTGVEFSREKRFAGETKYPLKKMIKFATDGIASFSLKPLKLASGIGVALLAVSSLYLLVALVQKIFGLGMIPGWAPILAVNLFFDGVVLLMLGIIGEYIGRIYDEAKGRPLYMIQELKNIKPEDIVVKREK